MNGDLSPTASDNAYRWVRAQFIAPDPPRAWSLTDPDFRLARVQSWYWSLDRTGTTRQTAARRLAIAGPRSPEWERFDEWSSDLWSMTIGQFFEDPWGMSDSVDPIGVDLEIVVFARTATWGDEETFAPGQPVLSQVVIMRLRDTWRVAGIGRVVAVPGWPPTDLRVR